MSKITKFQRSELGIQLNKIALLSLIEVWSKKYTKLGCLRKLNKLTKNDKYMQNLVKELCNDLERFEK